MRAHSYIMDIFVYRAARRRIHTHDILIAKLILIAYLRIHTSYFLTSRVSSTLFVLLRQLYEPGQQTMINLGGKLWIKQS